MRKINGFLAGVNIAIGFFHVLLSNWLTAVVCFGCGAVCFIAAYAAKADT